MDKLDVLVPGVVGRAAPFKVKKSSVRGSRKVWQQANQLRDFYDLQAVDTTFMAKALHALPMSLVTKCAVAANELGRSPAAYFISCVKYELMVRE